MQTHEPTEQTEIQSESRAAQNQSATVKQLIFSAFRNVTPARLALLLFANSALACLFCVAAVATIRQHYDAVKTLGRDAAPSVVAAYKIKSAVAAMDVDLSSELLYKIGDEDIADMQQDFDKRRVEVGKNIIANARNITYAAEQAPVESIQAGFGQFLAQSQKCRDDFASGKNEAALADYWAAMKLKDQLLNDAEKLQKANSGVLEKTYAEEKSATNLARGLVFVLGTILICMLVYTQTYLTGKFHRRFCPPLLLAIAALIFALNHITNGLGDNSKALVVAKEDAYDSALSLLNARAVSYNAAAASCRVLLDKENALEHQKEFEHFAQMMAQFDSKHTLEETIEHAKAELSKGKRVSTAGASGLLIDEISNICFPGEADAAFESLQHFGQFTDAIGKMFNLESNGRHAEAVHQCLSFAPSGCKQPLQEMDASILRALQINMDEMETAINRAFKDLNHLEIDAELVSVFAAICAYFGLMPRMEEYVHCQGQHKE